MWREGGGGKEGCGSGVGGGWEGGGVLWAVRGGGKGGIGGTQGEIGKDWETKTGEERNARRGVSRAERKRLEGRKGV